MILLSFLCAVEATVESACKLSPVVKRAVDCSQTYYRTLNRQLTDFVSRLPTALKAFEGDAAEVTGRNLGVFLLLIRQIPFLILGRGELVAQ